MSVVGSRDTSPSPDNMQHRRPVEEVELARFRDCRSLWLATNSKSPFDRSENPAVAEIVFVGNPFHAAQLQIANPYLSGVSTEKHAALSAEAGYWYQQAFKAPEPDALTR